MPSLRKSSGPSNAQQKGWRFESEAPQLKQIRITSPMINNIDSFPITTNFSPSRSFSGEAIRFDDRADENRDPQSHTSMPSSQRSVPGKLDPARLSSGSFVSTDHGTKEEETPPWSSAVGRATLGKSGRVIERLMAENDRLRREMRAEMLRREEVQKREDMSKPVTDGLRIERDNLLQMRTMDATLLARRDRKIEEMKANLEAERVRRMNAEKRAGDSLQRCEDEISARHKEVGEAREIAKHASSHAEVLEQSHRQLQGEYKQRVDSLNKDLRDLSEDREEEYKKLKRLDVVVEQLRQEIDRANKANFQMKDTFEAFKVESERRLKKVQQDSQKRQSVSALQEEVQRVLGETKYLINLTKNAMPG